LLKIFNFQSCDLNVFVQPLKGASSEAEAKLEVTDSAPSTTKKPDQSSTNPEKEKLLKESQLQVCWQFEIFMCHRKC